MLPLKIQELKSFCTDLHYPDLDLEEEVEEIDMDQGTCFAFPFQDHFEANIPQIFLYHKNCFFLYVGKFTGDRVFLIFFVETSVFFLLKIV